MEERRAEARYRAVKLVCYLVLDDDSQPLEVKDISRTGICLSHSADLPRGETRRIQLVLELGANEFSEPLELMMKVVWSTPLDDRVQIGGKFEALEDSQARALETVIMLLTRDVSLDPAGRPAFRTGLVTALGGDEK
jgi:hypothetical protein